MTNDDGFHILNAMPRLCYGLVEIMLGWVIVDLSKDIVSGRLGLASVNS